MTHIMTKADNLAAILTEYPDGLTPRRLADLGGILRQNLPRIIAVAVTAGRLVVESKGNYRTVIRLKDRPEPRMARMKMREEEPAKPNEPRTQSQAKTLIGILRREGRGMSSRELAAASGIERNNINGILKDYVKSGLVRKGELADERTPKGQRMVRVWHMADAARPG